MTMFLGVVLVLGSAALVMTIANGGSRGRGREILVMINGRGPNCGHGHDMLKVLNVGIDGASWP